MFRYNYSKVVGLTTFLKRKFTAFYNKKGLFKRDSRVLCF